MLLHYEDDHEVGANKEANEFRTERHCYEMEYDATLYCTIYATT